MTRFLSLLALVALASFAPSCKEKATERSGEGRGQKDSSADNETKRPSASPSPEKPDHTEDGDCDHDSPSTSGEGEAVTYKDIESIIETKCLTCHDTGGRVPDLSTYAKVKSRATEVKTQIDNGEMPPAESPQLTSTQKTKIRDWIADGKLESASTAEDSDSSSSSGSNGSDCDAEGTGSKESAWEEILNPAKLKECHDDGKVYDRGKKVCHISTWKEEWCTVDGIVARFKQSGATVSSSGGKISGFELYEVDQCGEYQGDPVVFFYQKVETEDEVGLNVKVLCKANSPACKR